MDQKPDEMVLQLQERLARVSSERDQALALLTRAEEARDLAQSLTLRFESEINDERAALARELHDGLGPHVTALRTMAATFESRLAGTDSSLYQLAILMLGTSGTLLGALRTLIKRIRPGALESGGLLDGVRSLLDDWRLRRADMRFELLLAPADDATFGVGDAEVEALAWQLVSDMIDRSVSRESCSMVIVSVRLDSGLLTIQISDDAVGFGRRQSDGAALTRLRDQVEALQGTLAAATGESGGAEVIAVLPWPGPSATV